MKDFNSHKKQVRSTLTELQHLIEKLQKLEESFLKQEEALYVISEFASDWEYWQDTNGDYQYVSPSCETVTGYTPDDFYDDPELLKKIIVADDWQKWQDHSHTMAANDTVKPIEFEITTKTGGTKWIHHVCRTAVNSYGDNIGIRGSNRDISELKALQEQLKHVAGHDHLTGLANRSLLMEHLGQRLKEAKRNKSKFIVAFIDLDGFKEINDQYGHDAGDHVLKRVAIDLRKTIRANDIIARFGGDEFVGIFNVTAQDDYRTLEKKIFDKISPSITCPTFKITVRLSVGISTYPKDGTTMDELLNKADNAMYAMKARNKTRYC